MKNSDSDKPNKALRFGSLFAFLILFSTFTARGQVPEPAAVFDFESGASYKLALYDQMLDYYQKLAAAGDRVKEVTSGQTVLGRPRKKIKFFVILLSFHL